MPKIKYIIWDWNGTLVNDAWLFVELMNEELSIDELKDVAGGLTEAVAQSKTRFRNKYEPKGDLFGKKVENKQSH